MAGFTANSDGTVFIGAQLDADSVDAIAKVIEAACSRGVTQGFAEFKKIFNSSATADGVKKIQDAVNAAGKSAVQAGNGAKVFSKNLNAASQEAYNLGDALQRIGQLEKAIAAAQYRARSTERQGAITDRERFSRDAQLRIETLKGENSRAASGAQGAAQQQVVAARYAGKQRVLIVQEVLRTIGRLEKALGATIAGIARTATSAISKSFSGLTSTLSKFGSSLRRTDSGFNQTLPRELRTRETLIRSSFSRQEKELRSSTIRQQRIIQQARAASSTGVLGAVSGRGAGGGIGLGGLAGGVGIGALLTSGFRRFSDLERINKQFLALTGNIDDTNTLLAQVKQFAKETPFDLVGVADLAKGFLAIKTPVDQVLPRVQAIADAVALTGGGVDSLNRIQRALGQIVSTGRLQGDELNQLAENLPGLNIRQILADQVTGGDVQALVALQEAGELSADAVVNGLITGLASDPRLAGASADLAKTLGGRVANLKESFDDFGAAIIGTIAGPLKVAVLGAQTVLQSLADFVKGEALSGPLLILREALTGAAVALTAVVVAKGAVEVFKLLAVSAQLLLSPMGLLLVGVATVGAAFNVLRTRSADFREAISLLGRYLVTQGSRIWDGIITAVHTVIDAFARTKEAVGGTADRIEREVKPASRFFRDLGDTIKRALFTATSFIVEKVIPALAEFAIFVGRNFVPAVSVAVGVVLGLVDRVVDIAKGIYTYVRPGLQTAIDGFHELANAIGAAFSGDFSGLEKQKTKLLIALTAGVTGLAIGGPILGAVAAAAVLVGPAIGKALQPIGRRVAEFFTELFSGPNIKRYISGVLDFVEAVGRTIGTIVSSPLFLKAVAAIAAAAVVIGFRFVKGFIEGVASNLPSFGDVLQAGLGLIFDNLGVVLGIALAAAIFGPRLLGLFRTGGATAGTSFASGLKASFGRGGDFLSSLFGGAGAADRRAIGNLFRGAEREARGLANQLRVLGEPRQVFGSPTSMREATDRIRELSTGLTAAQINGLRLRDTLQQGGLAIRGVFGGLVQASKGLGPALAAPVKGYIAALNATNAYIGPGTSGGKAFVKAFAESFRAGGGAIKDGFRSALSAVEQFSISQGKSIGRTLVNGLRTGAEAGLAALGGFMAGRAEGAAGGSGLLSAATAGLTAGLITQNPVIGVAAAGASLLGTQLGKAERAAKLFKERLAEIGSVIRGKLEAALKAGKDAVLDLRDAFSLEGEAGLTDEITKLLKPETLKTLLDAGVNSRELFAAFREGQPAVERLLSSIGGSKGSGEFGKLTDIQKAAFDVGTVFVGVAKEIESVNVKAQFGADGPIKRWSAAAFLALGGPGTTDTLGRMKDAIETLDPAFQRHIDDTKRLADGYDGVAAAVKGAQDNINAAFGPKGGSLGLQIDTAVVGAKSQGAQLAEALRSGAGSSEFNLALNDISSRIGTIVSEGVGSGAILTPEAAAFATDSYKSALLAAVKDNPEATAAIRALFDSIPATIKPELDKVKLKRDAQSALEGVTLFGVGKGKFNRPIGDIEAPKAPKVDIPSSSKTQGEWWRFGSDIATGAARGVTANTYKPVTAAVIMASKMAIAARKQSGIASPSKVFRQIGVFMGEGLAVGLQSTAALVSGAATRLVDRVVAAARSAGSGAADALKGVGSDIFAGMVGSGAELNTGNSLLQARGALTTAFSSLRDSLSGEGATTTLDINDALGVANIQQLTGAFDAIAEFGQVMLSQGVDASTVAIQLQQQVDVLTQLAVSMGFDQAGVAGLADSLGLSGAALGQFVSTAADAAAQIRQIAADLAATDLYQKSFGSQATGPNGNAGALASAQAGVTTAVQSVLSNFDTQIGQVFTLGASDYSKLNAADKALFDEIKAGKALSTDTTTVLGSANLASLTGAFDAIANLGQVMISQGSSAADVAAELKKQTAAATAKATALGFSVSTVAGVAAGLGLSNVAIDGYVTGAAAAAAAAAAPAPGAAAATAAVYALPPAAIPVYRPPVAPAAAAPSGPFTPSTAAEDAASAAANAAFVAQLINSGMLTTSGGSGLSGGPDPQAFINAVGPGLAKVIQQAIRAGG